MAAISLAGGSIVDLDMTLLVQLSIFLITFLILKRLLFKPFLRLAEVRRQETEGKRLAAESLEGEARKLDEEVEKRLFEARLAAGSEKDKMIEQARLRERDLAAKAREETRKAADLARKKMASEADLATQDLRRQVAGFASMAAGKVLGRTVSGGN